MYTASIPPLGQNRTLGARDSLVPVPGALPAARPICRGWKQARGGSHWGRFPLEVAAPSSGFECKMGLFVENFPQIHHNSAWYLYIDWYDRTKPTWLIPESCVWPVLTNGKRPKIAWSQARRAWVHFLHRARGREGSGTGLEARSREL